MKTKNKPTRNPCEQSLLVTPLSVEDCISKIEDMANFDLAVNIVHQSKYNAEIEFVERHNDDIPIYITSRLMASQNGTCVTFELENFVNGNRSNISDSPLTHSITVALGATIFWLVASIVIFTPSANTEGLLCLTPLIFLAILYRNGSPIEVEPAKYKIDTGKIRRLMRQRAEVLKGDLYDTLHVDPAQVRQDELGNEYYIDVTNQEGKTSS